MAELPILPIDLIRHEIYPRLPACDIFRLRAQGDSWNQAYVQATTGIEPADHINTVQPSRGGILSVRFLFGSDQLQQRATVDLRPRRNVRRLSGHFPAVRSPIVVASHQGFLCIRLLDPSQLVIWNPVLNELVEVPALPGGFRATGRTIGMYVHRNDRLGWSPRCFLAAVCLNQEGPEHQPNLGQLGVTIWRSGGQWTNPIEQGFLGAYRPKSVVTLRNRIYFQVSSDYVFIVNIPEDDDGPVNHFGFHFLPFGLPDTFMVNWRGTLATMDLVRGQGLIRVFTKNPVGLMNWQHTDTIDLVPIIDRFRPTFLSHALNLRNRLAEPAHAVLSRAAIVGYDDGFLFLFHRGGLVRISLNDNKARRIHHRGGLEAVFGLNSSFFRPPILA